MSYNVIKFNWSLFYTLCNEFLQCAHYKDNIQLIFIIAKNNDIIGTSLMFIGNYFIKEIRFLFN